MEIGDSLNEMLGKLSLFFLSPQNTSFIIHDTSYYKPDVASVCYVAQIYVKDEAL